MNKKNIAGKYALIAATGIVSVMLAASAYAGPPAPPPAATPAAAPAAPAATGTAAAMPTGSTEQMFTARKEQMLKNIGDRIAEMQQKQSCVKAAANMDAMRGCFPGAPTPLPVPAGKTGDSKATPPAADKH